MTALCHTQQIFYAHPVLNAQPFYVGFIVICPARRFGTMKFRLRRACESPGSGRFQKLRTLTHGLGRYPPSEYTELVALHEASPVGPLLFSAPASVEDDPDQVVARWWQDICANPQPVSVWHILYQAA